MGIGRRSRVRLVAATVVGASVLAAGAASNAVAEPPLEQRVVAPPGAEVLRARDLGKALPPTTTSFLDAYEDLDVTVEGVDTALVRHDRQGPWLLVTVVRLSSTDQAAAAREAVARTTATTRSADVLVGDGVGTRRVEEDGHVLLLEAYRVVGRDLVVWADLGGPESGSPLLHEAVEAHLQAFPPRSAGRTATLVGIAGAGLLATVLVVVVVVVVVRRRRRPWLVTRPSPADSVTGQPPAAPRVNW